MTDVRDVIIIGSGPAGYTAAIYNARANLAPLVLAGSVTAGGALMNTTDVENFPGFPDGIMGPELMIALQSQAERFGAQVLFDDATEVDLTGDIKVVKTATETYRSRAVILAMGSGYRELGVPGEKEMSGRGVSWCATCDGFFFKGQDIAVVGGGDSASRRPPSSPASPTRSRWCTAATRCAPPRSCRTARSPTTRSGIAWNSVVTRAIGQDGKLAAVQLRDTVTGEERELPVTGLFVAIGHDPRSELVKGQVDLDPEGYVLVEGTSTRTNLPGVFAVGDLVDHTYRQAVTAAGTGCAGALDAERYLADLDHAAASDGAAAALHPATV